SFFEDDGIHYAVEGDAPNWIAVDARGRTILTDIAAAAPAPTLGQLVTSYARSWGLEAGAAWVQVHDFCAALERAGLLRSSRAEPPAYPGRAALAPPTGLRELWLQLNNACNLQCSHCLVSSGPREDRGLPAEFWRRLLDRGVELGVERVYLTGGEPFLRKDLISLLRHATEHHGLEAIVLTNATAFTPSLLAELDTLDRTRIRVQVSVDGSRAETSDRIRGPGTFERALDGARSLAERGYPVALTTVAARENLAEIPELPALAKTVGAMSHHVMWAHRRGRALASRNGWFPPVEDLIGTLDRTIDAAADVGVEVDNLASVQRRVNGVPGLKYDLGNGAWDSLCVYADGTVYPTAALANEAALRCGDARMEDLADILSTSPVVRRLREATVALKPEVADDPFRFLTGGGDWEHAWCFSGGDPLASDPYYPIARHLVRRVMTTLGREKRDRRNLRSGYAAPLVLHAMGDGAIACGTADPALAAQPVLTLHSNCVLSFDVDKPRARVRDFYGAAAETPQVELCCPTRYDDAAVAHIPREVLDRFYGCGSPMASAGIQAGETVVDLGSGAGIDVFIAARLVGPGGRAIGVDMTDRMLGVARENQPRVAEALGYDVVEFREGFLERLPVESRSVDLVTSNCVVNLSPDKPRVFEETWRILTDHGRIVISDIVSEREVPLHLKVNPRLWGECLVGALTQEAFLAQLERAGFYGLAVLQRTYWKEVEGQAFFSITVQGYKYEKTAGCVFQGHRAVYLGPGKAFVDEEGHLFPRNEAYEICTDTVAKLGRPPYHGMFAILEPGEERTSYACCAPGGACC
ncbi:MAG: methyltransferase domain-containing protein, partial [Gemmatimonadetes bacterium]|nr:methyltransferase domain-containing protein [Gemmatimonadota bacterium]